MGVVEDPQNRDALASICQFSTSYVAKLTHAEDSLHETTTTLESYVTRMQAQQSGIYYYATSTQEQPERAPFLEQLFHKGLEILYLTDSLDEYVVMNLASFKSSANGKKYELIDVTRESNFRCRKTRTP